MAAPTVGFIGLGKMGRPMTMRLLAAGFQVTVHNRSQGVVEELAREGARLLLGGMSLDLFKEAVQLGHGNKDMSAMTLPLEQIAQTEIHPKRE